MDAKKRQAADDYDVVRISHVTYFANQFDSPWGPEDGFKGGSEAKGCFLIATITLLRKKYL
ncbi:MAG: hypothetical protein GWN86_19055 [Desulfobacterales bacterium]|nr:hypothetical protein [Desulfobacterales bacterium]